MAVLGHKILSMVSKYTGGGQWECLATSATTKLEETRTRTECESDKLEW